ncbi:hypothetical protein D1AOALGA4SA_786 [Olavius algarvensis Delta 1 endosymbiont]|nr:hypothetical protein D1AOALGA4SA_786 [Olavius algarvensis Delta 1 endosymbiont]
MGIKYLPVVKDFKIFLIAAMPSIIMSVMMLLLYPLFLYPEFTSEIVLEARKNSRRIATHFINEYGTITQKKAIFNKLWK